MFELSPCEKVFMCFFVSFSKGNLGSRVPFLKNGILSLLSPSFLLIVRSFAACGDSKTVMYFISSAQLQ